MKIISLVYAVFNLFVFALMGSSVWYQYEYSHPNVEILLSNYHPNVECQTLLRGKNKDQITFNYFLEENGFSQYTFRCDDGDKFAMVNISK